MKFLPYVFCASLLALAACSKPEPAKPAAVPAAFIAEEQAWRAERHANLTKPDGWASLIGLHWIDEGAHYVGSNADNGVRLALGPPHLGMLERHGDTLRFVPDRRAAITLDDKPLKAATALQSDDAATGPSRIAFDEGRGVATVIKRGDRYALRVKHADAATRTGFGTLDYWPATPAWRVTGRFVPHPAGTTIEIGNIIGSVDKVPNPGAVEFERDGRKYTLEAIDEGEDTLFLVFADRTSGHESYGAGRFVDATRPDAAGKVVIDFNQAYNPPCAFTPFATCPLPPQQNRLDLAVTAGEKKYHAAAH